MQHRISIQSDSTCHSVSVKTQDEESSTGSSIRLPATANNSNYIDNNSITHKTLLYKGALLRFTDNLQQIQARQGQLCIILQVPTESVTDLEVYIAPPGCRSATSFDEATLVACGWQKATVSRI